MFTYFVDIGKDGSKGDTGAVSMRFLENIQTLSCFENKMLLLVIKCVPGEYK